jgi:uncharacterized protein
MPATSLDQRRLEHPWGVMEIAIAADGMAASLRRLCPRESFPPEIDALLSALAAEGIVHGIDNASLMERVKLADRPGGWQGDLPFARATPAVAGTDSRLEFDFDIRQKPGKLRDDGSIDLRQRNLVRNVKAGQLLARIEPATAGRPGRTLAGEVLECTGGKDLEVVVGDNVRVDEGTGGFFSEIDGVVSYEKGCISVRSLFTLDGDVDYLSGDLEVDNDLCVTGTVRSGFGISAGGNVTVVGNIENGAILKVKGDLAVGGGILGEKTRVGIAGDLRCQFIQNASVSARGHIWVGSYVRNASVRCGASLTVERGGGRLGGSITGGRSSAGESIRLHSAGSIADTPTVLAVLGDMPMQKRLERLAQERAFCDGNITKMLRTLGLEIPDAESVRRLMQSSAPNRRELYMKILQQVNLLGKRRRAVAEEENALQRDNAKHLEQASIVLTGTLHGRSDLYIGTAVYRCRTDIAGGRFILRGKVVVPESTGQK